MAFFHKVLGNPAPCAGNFSVSAWIRRPSCCGSGPAGGVGVIAIAGKDAQKKQDEAKSKVEDWLKGLGY